jgi:hypothetical protein
MDEDRKLPDWVWSSLALFERAYHAERNGLFVWRAYLLCIKVDISPLPDWITDYLVRVASGLVELSMPGTLRPEPGHAEPRDPGANVFEALEIDPSRRGRRGFGGVLAQDGRDLHLAIEVQWRGGSIYAIEAVATEYGLTRSLVHRAWKRYEALLHNL